MAREWGVKGTERKGHREGRQGKVAEPSSPAPLRAADLQPEIQEGTYTGSCYHRDGSQLSMCGWVGQAGAWSPAAPRVGSVGLGGLLILVSWRASPPE